MRDKIFKLVSQEVERARELFPSNEELVLSYVEESGEFIKAILDQKAGKGNSAEVLIEGVQAIAMIVRLLEEGDKHFPFSTFSFLNDRRLDA